MRLLTLLVFLSLSACQTNIQLDNTVKKAIPVPTWKSVTSHTQKSTTPAIIEVDKWIDVDGASITFKFSEEVQRIDIESIKRTITPNLPCVWYWEDARHLTCDVDSGVGLKPATAYSITLGEGLYGKQGKNLKSYTYYFESLRPVIDRVNIDWKSPIEPEIEVEFNIGVNPKSLAKNLFLKDSAGSKVYLAIFPNKVPFEDSEPHPWSEQSNWKLKPTKKLKENTKYILYQNSKISTPYGKLTSKRQRISARNAIIKTYGDFEYTGHECSSKEKCYPGESVRLNFSVPINKEDVSQCEEKLKNDGFKLFANNYGIRLSPLFANKTNRAKCLESIRDVFGRALKKRTKIEIITEDFQPFQHNFYSSEVITKDDKLVVENHSINYVSLDVKINEVDFDEVSPSKSYKQRAVEVKFEKNKQVVTNILPDVLLESSSVSGIVNDASSRWNNRGFFIQKSNYNVIVQYDDEEALVFISDIKTNKPISNIDFKVAFFAYDYEDRKLIEMEQKGGKTNKFGVAVVKGLFTNRDFYYRSSLLFELGNGEQFAIKNSHKISPETIDKNEELWRDDGEKVFWGITDKPLYRPGETVRYSGFLRKIDGVELKVTELEENTIIFVDGYNIDYYDDDRSSFYLEKKVEQDNFGRIAGKFKIPHSLPDGRYSISLDNDKYNESYNNELFFEVANYRKQKLHVIIEPQLTGVLMDEQFSVVTRAKYYSGGPYRGANSEFSFLLEESELPESFLKHSQFYFKPNNMDDDSYQSDSYFYDGGELNNLGESNVSIALPTSNLNYGKIELQSSIITDEGEVVFSRVSSIPFSRKSHYVGIKKLDWWLRTNQEVILESRVVDLNGQEKTDAEVHYYIQELNNLWSRKFDKERHEKKLLECEQNFNEKRIVVSSSSQCIFVPKETGYYKLIAEISYSDGTTQESSTSHYFYNNNKKINNELVIQAPQDELTIGGLGKFKLKHGLEKASALITVHRGRLLDYWWQPLKKGLNEITFEVKEAYAPGFDITIFVNYGDLKALKNTESPNYAQVITQRFKVKPKPKKRIVELGVAAKKFKPGEVVRVTLANKADQKSAVTLAVIDESIINQLGNNQYYKLENTYLGSSDLSWSSPKYFELVKRLYASQNDKSSHDDEEERIIITGSRIRRAEFSSESPITVVDSQDFILGGISNNEDLISGDSRRIGNTQAKILAIRSLFKDSAYWNDKIVINGNSSKTLNIKLPDNLTQWKIIAISALETGEMFVDDKSIKTSKNLEVHAEIPGQLTKGDRFLFQAEIISKSEDIKNISLSSAAQATPENKLINEISGIFSDINLYDRNKIEMEVVTTKEGDIEILTVADAESESDAILQSAYVHSRNLLRTQSYYSILPEEEKLLIEVPKSISDLQGTINFKFSGSVASNLNGTFNYMKKYSHQCWEQKLSRAIVAVINLDSRVNNTKDTALLKSQINDALQSINGFQAIDGGMSFFGNKEGTSSTYLTAFTYKSLHYLSHKNIQFPELNTSKLKNYLNNQLRDKNVVMTLELAAIIINALASDDSNKAIIKYYLPTLLEGYTKLDVFSQSQILEVIAKYPEYKEQAKISSLLDKSRVTAKKRLFAGEDKLPWYFYNFGAKKYCAAISSLIANHSDKKIIHQLINGVLDFRRKNKGDFGNTLSNAYCSIAISDYVSEYEDNSSVGKYNVSVLEKSFSLNRDNRTHQIKASLDKALVININKKNSGSGYLQTTLEYLFDGMKEPAIANGFSIKRSYYKYKGDKWIAINEGKLEQGDFVKVKITINNPLFRRYVAITDTLPGTFFALDEGLSTSAPSQLFEMLYKDYYFNEKQFTSRNVKFYADILPAGEHIVEYLVRVTHQGEFSALPAKIEEMYDDDVYATSKPTEVVIH